MAFSPEIPIFQVPFKDCHCILKQYHVYYLVCLEVGRGQSHYKEKQIKFHLGFYMFKNIYSSTFAPKLPMGSKIATVAIRQFFNLSKSPSTKIEQLRQRNNPWTTCTSDKFPQAGGVKHQQQPTWGDSCRRWRKVRGLQPAAQTLSPREGSTQEVSSSQSDKSSQN